MKNRIFLDCGQFDGVAIEQYCVDDSWEIFSFEPDPKPLPHLPPLTLYQAAAWTDNGVMEFSLDPRQQASHLSGLAGTEFENTMMVQTIDFSAFVRGLPKAPIVCSMDCEGAEFPILRKMIKDGTAQRLSVLDIEFHHRMMADEDDNSARKLMQELSALGVIVRLKIVLNK